ncbi:MAG: DUF1592 domain-containing protein [Vicinamibacterales bacterium]
MLSNIRRGPASSAIRVLVLVVAIVAAAPTGRAQVASSTAPASSGFDRQVQPMMFYVCSNCHKEIAGVSIDAYSKPESIANNPEGWEKIIGKLRSGEMPPPDELMQPSPAEVSSLITFIEGEFDRHDRTTTSDPGRVPTHRLNRIEYQNTVRDLLGVDFRATEEFPPDDSGYGFDNIGDVLTVSPALMEKYLSAGERIAARAIGGDPLPPPGVFTRRDRVRNIGDSTIELAEVVDYDADYVIKINITGHRGAEDLPVTLAISVDGKTVKTSTLPVQISAVNQKGGATQRAVDEARVSLTGGRHVFRAAFVNDETLKKIPLNARTNVNQNIFPEFIELAGPYKSTTPAAARKTVLACNPATGRVCVNRIMTGLTRRAYRRPVTAPEVARLMKVYDRARAAGYTGAQSLQFAVSALLVSPQFLFRIEKDPAPGTTARLSDVELASRLSYFLWSSMPDDELLTLAESNRLHLPQVLDAQLGRMLASPKASALADNFAGQWLETRSLDAVKRDAQKFPGWTPELRDAMRTETRMFFEAVLQENRPLSDFINGNYTFLNERLARHYGIAGVEGPDFRKVALSTDQRSGVFTQGSVLTVSAYPTRTSVVLRGKYLLDNVFNAPPPPPPADVPVLDETKVGVAQSLRLQMESHRTQPLCASCHRRMDPLGFALENYDAIGRWRTEDGKFPIDSSGQFPNGKSFSGPAQLKSILLESMPDFTRGVAERMLTYALGRGVEAYDRPTIRALVQATTDDGYRIQSLIRGIVHSVPFQQRRGETTDVRVAQLQEARVR